MAAEIQTGNGKLYGITNSGSAFTMSGFATFVAKSKKLNHKFDLQADKDGNNADNTLIATNAMIEGTLEFEPSGATRAAAAAVAVFLAPLAKVTLANFALAALNGDWIYVGNQSIDLADGASAKISLPVRKYTDSTQNTSLTTTVTG
jgi:hypothetical protein